MSKKIYYYKESGENNIPESYKVSLSPPYTEAINIWDYSYYKISPEEYLSLEKENKLLYSLDGVWFINNSGVLWKIKLDSEIRVYPVSDDFKTRTSLPRSVIKLWGDKDEFQEYKEKTELAKKKKEAEYQEKKKSLKDLSFSFYTPRMIIKEIIKPTKKISIGVGDIVHGEIKVVEGGIGFLHRSTGYANYIEVYVNGESQGHLPFTYFQELFLNNFRVEILGYSYLEP